MIGNIPLPKRPNFSLNDDRPLLRKAIPIVLVGIAGIAVAVLGYFSLQEKTEVVDVENLPLVEAKKEPYKFKPDDEGGLKIDNQDKQVFQALEKPDVAPNAEKATAEEALLTTDQARDEVKKVLEEEPSQTEQLEKKMQEEIRATTRIRGGEESPVDRKLLKKWEEELKKTDSFIKLTPMTNDEIAQIKAERDARKKAIEEAILVEAKTPKPVAELTDSDRKDGPNTPEDALSAISKTAEILASKNDIYVQLGAFKNIDGVKKGWEGIKTRFEDILVGYSVVTREATVPGQGRFYRLQLGVFDDESEARRLCAKLNAKNQGCIVVKP